jgi:hypothetical protein
VTHTGDIGDIGVRDTDCCITYVRLADDVFKASDDKVSPFELDSAGPRNAVTAAIRTAGIAARGRPP